MKAKRKPVLSSSATPDIGRVSCKALVRVPDELRPLPISMPEITAREAQVVGWLAQGLSNKGIAAQLTISSRTVQTHLERMFKKLGVRSRAELVARVYMNRSQPGN